MLLRCLLVVLLLSLTSPSGAQSLPAVSSSDQLDGVPYRFDRPAQWNGDWVLWLHGYEPSGSARAAQWPQDPIAPLFLRRGFAVAATAYRQQGWAVEDALRDSRALLDHLSARYGAPRRVFVVGLSMGGLVALASLEREPTRYAGALSLCGVNASAETFFNAAVLPPLLAFNLRFPEVLPYGEAGLINPHVPAEVDPRRIERALADDPEAAAALAMMLQQPVASLATTLALNYSLLNALQQRAGGHPLDNRSVQYSGMVDPDGFNREVRRYAADPAAAAYLQANVSLNGKLQRPAVLLSNQDDPIVPAQLDQHYPRAVAAAGAERWLTVLPKVGRGHCDFSPEQIDSAFSQLLQQSAENAP